MPRYSLKDEFNALNDAMAELDEAMADINKAIAEADLILKTEKKKGVSNPKFTTRPGRELKELVDEKLGYTPLHSATRDNKIKIVQELIAAGADLNKKDYAGMTPLILAADYDHPEVARLLVDAGADLLIKDHSGRAARDRASGGEMERILKDAPKRQKQLAEERAATNVRKDYLLQGIAAGDCDKVRNIFDQNFWEQRDILLGWEHLKIALQHEDRAMMRLLITWGAAADAEGMAELTEKQATMLRQCGLRLTGELPPPKPVDPFENHRIENIPHEWLRVLHALQGRGAHEATIAGGALRDTFNGAPVRDVDIFLQTRGGTTKNKKFLQGFFKDTKLKITKQRSMAGYGAPDEAFPDPKIRPGDSTGFMGGSATESWTVIAGPENTEYNIIFMEGPVREELKNTFFRPRIVPDPPANFAQKLIERFDIGLCQVACDGEKIIMTGDYKFGVENKCLVVENPNSGTYEHQKRLKEKYPKWELWGGVEAPKKPAPAYSGYSYDWNYS